MLYDSVDEIGGIEIKSGGRLIFDPDTQTKLTTNFITIEDGGSLEIGSATCPFTGDAEIQLCSGSNQIVAQSGAKLEIHGEEKLVWTKLAEGMDSGDSSAVVMDDVEAGNWRVGDKVVIASTDYNWEQAEIMTVASVDGSRYKQSKANYCA